LLATARPLSAEFLLVAACCIWPPSQRRTSAIREAVRHVTDWPHFVCLVERHRVAGLVYHGLSQIQLIPKAQAAELHEMAKQISHQNLRLAGESLRLQDLLDGSGIACLFVKGTSLGVLAYGTLGIKHAWDIDLLISPDRAEDACKLLLCSGYARVVPPPHFDDSRFLEWMAVSQECLFHSKERGTFLELHWRLTANSALLPGLSVDCTTQSLQISEGLLLRTLATCELFCYLCVHGAIHGWSRLKWLSDVEALMATLTEAEITTLYEISLVKGAGRSSAQALLLCASLFGREIPSDLKTALLRDKKTRWLHALALNAMASGGVKEIEERFFSNLPITLSHFLLNDRLSYLLKELRSKLVGQTDTITISLPTRLRFLYPLLRVPSWIWRHVIIRALCGRTSPTS